jgi:hypothetical protein
MQRREKPAGSLWGLAIEGWVFSVAPLVLWAWHTGSPPLRIAVGLWPLPEWIWLAVLWAGPTWIALRVSAVDWSSPPVAPVARAYSCGVRLALLTGMAVGLVPMLIAAGRSTAGSFAAVPVWLLPALADALMVAVSVSGVLALLWGSYAAWLARALVLSRWPALAGPPGRHRRVRRAFPSMWQRLCLALRYDPGIAHCLLGHSWRGTLWLSGWHLLPPLTLVGTSGLVLALLRAGIQVTPGVVLWIAAFSLLAALLLHGGYALLTAADLVLGCRERLPVPAPTAPAAIPSVRPPALRRLAGGTGAGEAAEPGWPPVTRPQGPAAA